MANTPKTMLQIRRIIQLIDLGKKKSEVAQELGISLNTVKSYIGRIEASGLSASALHALDDEALGMVIYPTVQDQPPNNRQQMLNLLLPDYYCRLRDQRHLTRELIWMEYISSQPEGYRYSQFCEHLSRYSLRFKAVMHQEHVPGQEMEIDFAGAKLSYVDRETGQIIQCPVLVCVLPFSSQTYVEALPSQKLEPLISGLNNCLQYYGAVPLSIKSDNLKQVVTKPDRYEPVFTDLMQQFALHYHTSLMAARPYKPRDKATVEGSVNHVYHQIYALLEGRIFYSLEELNYAILQLLDAYNRRQMQRREYSRYERYINEEKPLMQELPETPFILKHKTKGKVQKDCYVTLGEDWHHYSAPYQHIGEDVKVIYDLQTVEIYLGLKRIAIHRRNFTRNGYTTDESHLPPNIQAMRKQKGYTPDFFLWKAQAIGSNTREYISRILESRFFKEQTYRSCWGIIRLSDNYGNERVEKACTMALQMQANNLRTIKTILLNNRDKYHVDTSAQLEMFPKHTNIRGSENYN